jgi:hypothetical protein
MIAAIVLALLAVAGGVLASYLFDRDAPVYARLAMGTVVGMTILAFAAFGLALPVGMHPIGLTLAGLVVGLPLLLLRRRSIRSTAMADLAAVRDRASSLRRRPTAADALVIVYGLAIGAGIWLVANKNYFEQPDGLYIGNVNNLGDLPYHLSISASFAYGHNFPPHNPVFAGVPFSYHYMADFLAAVFAAAGASLVEAMLLLNLALGASLLALVHRWTRDLTGSPGAARLAPLLLAFSGGLGWLKLFDEARGNQAGIVGAFFDSATRYTIEDGIVRFGNAVTTLLIPQRGLLLGMGLAVIVFTLLWQQLQQPPRQRASRAAWPRMIAAGVATGVLPIIHMHTFAVVLGTAFLWGLVFSEWRAGLWRPWAAYVISAAALALPTLAWTTLGSQASFGAFFGVELGWDHGQHNPIWFWLVNTGVFIPLVVLAYAWRGERPLLSRRLVLYSLPFIAWFIAPNIFRLAPWLWDNIKVLIYFWLGMLPLVALVLVRLWREGAGLKVASVGLAFVLMAAGALDVGRAIVGPDYREFERDGIQFAAAIRQTSQTSDVILTAPSFNSPVFLSGRRVVMGYAGFLWANGLPYGEREQELRAIYAGEPSAMDYLRKNRVAYIVVGPEESRDLAPNEEFLAQFPVAIEVGEYRLLQTGIQ